MDMLSLKNGESGQIIAVNAKGEIRRRLLDMGVVKGVPFSMIRKAPLGDPIEIRIKRFNLSLRREEAAQILIERRVEPEASEL